MYSDNTHLRRATSAPQRYRVGPIISNASFHYALENSPYSRDPKYVQAVMRSYIEVKEARGRSKQEIAWKLELLERELPGYVNSFMAIREEKRLPPSRVFRGRTSLSHHPSQISIHQPQRESLQDQYILGHRPGGPARQPSSASSLHVRPTVGQGPSGPSRTPSQLQQTLRASATAAPARNPEDTDEPPPPPYASEDPEPEATRDLQIRLASEAEAAGRLNLPEPTVTSVNNHGSGEHQQEESGAGRSNEGASPNNASATPTTANSTHQQNRYSPPPGPPPNTGASLQREPSRRSEHHPSTPPTDPEEARMWEESQLEEAIRLSKAAERERNELEEAMRLSLADSGTSSSGQEGGGNGWPEGSSSTAFPTMPPVFEGREEEDSSGPTSRRVSSYNPSQDLEGHHRRTASDARYQEKPSVNTVTSGMEHLAIPDGWGTNTGSSSSTGQNNLMDDDYEEPLKTSHPALSPQKTGAVMRSNNPFLSPGETAEDGPPPMPSTPSQKSRQVEQEGSSSTPRDSPVSSRTQYQSSPGGRPPAPDKGLPAIPDSSSSSPATYDPPPEAPPRPSGSDVGVGRPPPLPQRTHNTDTQQGGSSPVRRPLPVPQNAQNAQPPSLPKRNISSQMYSAANPPQSSFPNHSPNPKLSPSPSFFPPQSAAQPSPQSAALHRAISASHGGEDPLEMLREYHTVFLVDDSTSMSGERWAQARGALMGVAETAARYDESGVDIYFLNSKRVGKELRTPEDVEDVFAGLEPRGATPTGLRLEAILRDYMNRLERSVVASPGLEPSHRDHVRPMNLIVVTDGVFAHPILARKRGIAVNPALDRQQLLGIAPVDDPESVLIACAKRLDKGDFPLSQVGVQFLQIGDDSEAREALQELDEGLAAAHGVRDMVDTVLFTGEEVTTDLIVKTLLGGINRRLDKRS